MSNVTGIVSRENEGQITSANATMQDMAGRGILRYELPLAKIIMLVFTGVLRRRESEANSARIGYPLGLRSNVARTLCIVEPLHVNPGSGHPSCMGELCGYLSL